MIIAYIQFRKVQKSRHRKQDTDRLPKVYHGPKRSETVRDVLLALGNCILRFGKYTEELWDLI